MSPRPASRPGVTADPQARTLVLVANGSLLELAPHLGGSVVRYVHGGIPVLRSAAWDHPQVPIPFGMAAFPLFPFCGRIAAGRFRFDGREIALPPNLSPEPHAIHGESWLAPWTVEAAGEHTATLVHEHPSDAWPWPYRAMQTFELTTGALLVSLALTNKGDRPMPAGLGWHPYFPKGDAQLEADVSALWQPGHDKIPSGPQAIEGGSDLRTPRRVAHLDLDDAFSVGVGGSVIRWPDRKLTVRMTATVPLGHLVVFAPPAQDFFCVEPVSHAPNAVNSSLRREITGLRVLEPRETLIAQLTLAVERG